MKSEIIRQETEHLESVKGKLELELARQQQFLARQREELLEERRTMWEECSHNVKDFDDIVMMNAHDERVREGYGHYVRIDAEVRQLKYLLGTPYFGRVDFLEEGSGCPESIYIGRYGFCNRKTYEYHIYDWRSPIANMFYECSPGKAGYDCPAGRIEGELTCKRQYQIREGRLEYCYDTNMAVRDELLGKVLSENTDKVLRVIIDTITKDQNFAIRQPFQADLLIMGPAGSGKTSVGMHRLAYLLYHNRSSLASDKIVVMSRNQIFSSYISGILPELGEENVHDVLFDELINRGISREFKKTGYYEQVEYFLGHQQETVRRRGIELKYSEDFLEYLKEALRKMRFQKKDAAAALEIYGFLLEKYCEREGVSEISAQTRSDLEHFLLHYEDMLVVGYIRVLTGGIRAMEQISHVVLDEAQDYNRLQLRILKALYPKSRFTILADPNQAVYPVLSTMAPEEFRRIFGSHVRELSLQKSYRSTAPINAYAFSLLGIENPELYIDRPGKDPEQIRTSQPYKVLQDLLKNMDPEKSVAILTCDREGADRVRKGLGGQVKIEFRKRQNEQREKAEEDGRGSAYLPEEEAEKLSHIRKIEYIMKPDRTLEEKTVVMPIMLAKGLEFDVVIIWDDRPESYWAENYRLKYLMCTRALHELYIVTRTEDK